MIIKSRVIKAFWIYIVFGVLYALTLGIHTSEFKSGLLNDRVQFGKILINHIAIEKGAVNLCVEGVTNINPRIRNYSVSISLERFIEKKSENYIKKEILYIPSLNVPIASMQDECSGLGEIIVAHEYDNLNLDYDGQINYLRTHAAWLGSSELYVFKDNQTEKKSLYIYLNVANVNDYFSINFRGEKLGVSSKIVFEVIFDLAKDIATFPYQLILWFGYLGSN